MIKYYDVYYNGVRASHVGIHATRRPSIPMAEAEMETYTIPGRDGILTRFTGAYREIALTIEFSFMSKQRPYWSRISRSAHKWLTSRGDQKLFLMDDSKHYYKVKYVEPTITERPSKRIGTIEATFICDPYVYHIDGDKPIEIENHYGDDYYHLTDTCTMLFNKGHVCKPEYKISTGGRSAYIVVNGNLFKLDAGGTTILNTDLMEAHRETGESLNTLVAGDYSELWLAPGENKLSLAVYDTFSPRLWALHKKYQYLDVETVLDNVNRCCLYPQMIGDGVELTVNLAEDGDYYYLEYAVLSYDLDGSFRDSGWTNEPEYTFTPKQGTHWGIQIRRRDDGAMNQSELESMMERITVTGFAAHNCQTGDGITITPHWRELA